MAWLNQELNSWKNSLVLMDRIVEPDEVPNDAGIAIEMGVPQSGKRIDFVLTGLNQEKKKVAIMHLSSLAPKLS